MGRPQIKMATKIVATAGNSTVLTFIPLENADIKVTSITIAFLSSVFAHCLFEWGKSGEFFRGIEGVSIPTRLAESSRFVWNGVPFIVRGGNTINLQVTTNVDGDTVKSAFEFEVVE